MAPQLSAEAEAARERALAISALVNFLYTVSTRLADRIDVDEIGRRPKLPRLTEAVVFRVDLDAIEICRVEIEQWRSFSSSRKLVGFVWLSSRTHLRGAVERVVRERLDLPPGGYE